MRLIDAEDFERVLLSTNRIDADSVYEAVSLLNKQPTAYDVEAVIMELNESRKQPTSWECICEIIRRGGTE